ncbi:MAG: hypothetical protein AB7N76_19460 [Planctomycetota bacterium]
MTRPHRALVVGSDPSALEVIQSVLGAHGHELTRLRTLVDAERALASGAFCYALIGSEVEPHARGTAGVGATLSLLRRIRRAYTPQALPVAVFGDLERIARQFGPLVWAGCSDLLLEPLDAELLDRRVGAAALMCEARRRACSTLPSPPLAGQRVYGVERAVHFAGVSQAKRLLVTVDDEELFLPRSLYEGLLELALALLQDPERYTPRKSLFGDHPNPAVSRLLRELRAVGAARGLQHDRQGGLRLSVPPDRLSFAVELLSEEVPHLARRLAVEADAR